MLYAIWKEIIVAVCRRKRRQRKAELRHHIALIRDVYGCVDAMKLYKQCKHLSEHWLIPLSEVGFIGDIYDLYAEIGRSLERAEEREEMIKFPTVSKSI